MWLFGALEPDCYGALIVQTGESILFVPRQPPDYATWSGPIHSLDFFKEKYGVTYTFYSDEVTPKQALKLNYRRIYFKGRKCIEDSESECASHLIGSQLLQRINVPRRPI